MKKIIISALLAFAFSTHAATYKYSELVVKDYDEMLFEVLKHVKAARQMVIKEDESEEDTDGAKAELREALKFIFSRPNSDNMVAKLTPEVRRELVNLNAYEDTIMSLAKEAVAALKTDNLPAITRATYLFLLENLLGEIAPEVSNEDLRSSIEFIRDAKIKISPDVRRERKLRGMYTDASPSDEAKRILEKFKKQKIKESKFFEKERDRKEDEERAAKKKVK